MSGIDNLIPNELRTPEELREMTRKGGIKSGIVRREKKKQKEILENLLSIVMDTKGIRLRSTQMIKNDLPGIIKDNMTIGEIIGAVTTAKAIAGDMKAIDHVINRTEGMPKQTMDLGVTNLDKDREELFKTLKNVNDEKGKKQGNNPKVI
jgi:hypothetical protein